MMEFKDALRRRRVHLGLTEDQLAKLITRYGSPVTGADVQLWERGRNIPPLEVPEFRQALASALQTTVEKIEKGMRHSLKASELDPAEWSVEAIRAAELIESMAPEHRVMALSILKVIQSTSVQANKPPRDFWES